MPFSGPEKAIFMKELRIGLIGCAGRGTHADHANLPGKARVVAGADRYPEQRQMFLDRYREKYRTEPAVYTDYREMIDKEQLDGVVIASPDFLHESMPSMRSDTGFRSISKNRSQSRSTAPTASSRQLMPAEPSSSSATTCVTWRSSAR